ncbi:ABC-F family ATP-binding cassette domain-containing protein [Reinekea sp.]|jgi:ATP-binding cassette subfamily F protein 3|uniref:ABC-F family ATP-binding cassette domain-containing protein n=1 Tax=Reinekea sp. TaxID=1970455 RepID=UPI003989AF4F
MSLISVLQVSYQAGSKPLFSDLSCHIDAGDRVGVVGHNGCGKSTLLNLILGRHSVDDGRIHIQRGLKIGIVEQFLPEQLLALAVVDCVSNALPVDERLAQQYIVEALLVRLGFAESLWQRPIKQLSGGQKNLILFARAIVQDPELLLLDEPGNHMDSRAMFYLKQYLSSSDAPGFLMISHDRDLLDSVTTKTFWLRDQRLYQFNLPYTKAKVALSKHDEDAQKRREAEEREVNKLKKSAKRLAQWGKDYDNEDLARKAKTMERRVEKLEQDFTFVSQGSGLSLNVDADLLRSKQVLIMESELVRNPVGIELFQVQEMVMRPGDRIVLLGINGAGKSSCIEHLMRVYRQDAGEQQHTRFNPNVSIGYFDQELAQFEQPIGIMDWCREQCKASEEDIKQTLIHWGFPFAEHDRRVNVLSGGERARLLLLTFQLDQPNVLVMDEPTNHIDLQGKEELEASLVDQSITLLFTSHDQRFIETVATRYWWIHQGKLIEVFDLQDYFSSLNPCDVTLENKGPQTSMEKNDAAVPFEFDEEKMLERIIELETLLEEDCSRKEKFQKPKLQLQWQEELNDLTKRLDA